MDDKEMIRARLFERKHPGLLGDGGVILRVFVCVCVCPGQAAVGLGGSAGPSDPRGARHPRGRTAGSCLVGRWGGKRLSRPDVSPDRVQRPTMSRFLLRIWPIRVKRAQRVACLYIRP